MTIAISDIQGLVGGQSLVLTEVTLSFGFNAPNEQFTINAGSPINFSSTPETFTVPQTGSVTVGAAGGAGVDTRFAISEFSVEVIPEPSTGVLALLGLSATLLRRRR